MGAVNLIPDFRWSVVRDEIIKEMTAISAVKVVHNRLRFDQGDNEERFRKLFLPEDSGRVNGWTVQRLDESRVWDTNREIQVFVLVGLDYWLQLEDKEDTQAAFDDVIDDVMTAFQAPIRLDCNVELQGPMQLVTEDHRQFAGKLVHHAEIQTTVEARVLQETFR